MTAHQDTPETGSGFNNPILGPLPLHPLKALLNRLGFRFRPQYVAVSWDRECAKASQWGYQNYGVTVTFSNAKDAEEFQRIAQSGLPNGFYDGLQDG
jgi:hypothetical protein